MSDRTDTTERHEVVADRLRLGGERPALVIKTVALMLLGAGLALALILKAYMFVLTDHACTADADTLGNAIRCTPTLSLLSTFLALAAGLELSFLIFAARFDRIFGPLILAFCATVFLILSDLGSTGAGWQTALLIATLMAGLSALVLLRYALDRIQRRDREP